ncbi:acyl-CoA synthetase [Sporobolomyces koalae]|uniref:acyl-CoA synthetase n=1 Tax=Sporobolomyces koalae TaxID=500713 RepID=UPI0031746612
MLSIEPPSSDFSLTELRRLYSNGIPCPDDFSFPTHVLDHWASVQPEECALWWVSHDFAQERKVSYRQLKQESVKAAKVFRERGIKKGDKVMIQTGRVVEWWFAVFGLMRIGAVAVPGTSLLVAKDLKYRAESCKAVAFVGDDSACQRFEEISSEVGVNKIYQITTNSKETIGRGRIDLVQALHKAQVGEKENVECEHKKSDLAIVFFTSGTTSNPKLVLLEAEYTLGHTISGLWYKIVPGKVMLCMADLGWAKASYGSLGTFNLGGTYFVQPPPPGPFKPTDLLETLHRYPIESLCAPPTIYRGLVTQSSLRYLEQNPFKALNHCVGAGEPLNPSVIKEWRDATGLTIRDGWGQSETVILVGNWDGEVIKDGSMGKAAPSFEIGIIGPNGEELKRGEEGELAVRTDSGSGSCWIFKGYIKNGKIDKRQKSHGGKTWYCTGDRGLQDEDDYFHFVGRDDDVITSSGYRVGPFEVESALKSHPAVLESAAVGSPDLARGELIKAFVILSEGYKDHSSGEKAKALIADILNHFRKTTAPYKVPREIEFVEELPKTVSGKIRRVELRDLEKARKKDILAKIKAKL